MKTLLPEHLKSYLDAANARDVLPMFYLELSADCARVSWWRFSGLDTQHKIISVSKQYVRNPSGAVMLSRPKTETSVRQVSIPQDAVDLLVQEHSKHPDNQYMFPSPVTGEMYHPDSVVKLQKILKDTGLEHIRFHDLRHLFATMSLEHGMDIKTLSTIIGHVSSSTTLNIYAHVTDEMRQAAARKIDRGIGKAEFTAETESAAKKSAPSTFQPYKGKRRKPGTGCVTQINDHLWEGRYSPVWPDGKKHPRNIYAHSEEECEKLLAEMIIHMKAEIASEKERLNAN